MITRKKLYTLLFVACLAGYAWVLYNLPFTDSERSNSMDVCLIKHVTDIPCPSCGSTRSTIALVHGDILQSLYINPMGLIITLIMLLSPIWIVFDIARRKATLYRVYQRLEQKLKQPIVSIPLIILVFVNWIWNISKGL